MVCSGHSQITQEMYDKKVEEIAILKKQLEDATTNENNLSAYFQNILKTQTDTIKILNSNLSSLEKYKSQKKIIDTLLKTKSDSITLLKAQLLDKDEQITTIRQQVIQRAQQEKEQGKQEALIKLLNTYKKPFDDLIKSSSKESIQRDMLLVGDDAEVKQILNELQIYFDAKELIAKKFDDVQIKNAQTQVKQIRQKSTLLDKLEETVGKYQIFNNGLKEVIDELVTLDNRESVAGMDEEIQKQKFNKIMSEISAYIFNYDFNLMDYPYLSDIILEIIKRKQPNADANITDLLNKL